MARFAIAFPCASSTLIRSVSAISLLLAPYLVRQTVHEVVDAQLVRLVGLIDGTKSLARPFPELRDIGVVVDDDLEPLARIVVLIYPAEDGLPGIVGLRHDVEPVDLEEGVKNGVRRLHVEEAD